MINKEIPSKPFKYPKQVFH